MKTQILPRHTPGLWAVLLLGLAACLWGQQRRSVILGRVADQTGAAIAEAQVTLTNMKTGISSRTTTGATGDYTFTNLDPGTYQVTAERAGFKTAVIQNLTLFVAETVRADIQLDVGDLTTKIEVVAAIPVVQSETSSVGNVVDSNQVVRMPLNGAPASTRCWPWRRAYRTAGRTRSSPAAPGSARRT